MMNRDQILHALKQAIQAEVEGHHFYLMAARTTQDVKGREVFEQLAKDEVDHMEHLRAQYRSVLETGAPDASLHLGPLPVLRGESPIFTEGLKARAGEAHFEMTALSVGVQLELQAETFYRKQAEECGDEGLAKFWNELAEWESGHYHLLLRQQEFLKEDYWSTNSFSPF
jgi:rubrerythrin